MTAEQSRFANISLFSQIDLSDSVDEIRARIERKLTKGEAVDFSAIILEEQKGKNRKSLMDFLFEKQLGTEPERQTMNEEESSKSQEGPKTTLGRNLDEVISALQKCIRRGMEREAAFFAFELIEAGFYRYMWRRLLICASEDIGTGDPEAVSLVNALAQGSRIATNDFKSPPDANLELHAVITLCRANKNREVNDLRAIVERNFKAKTIVPIPDFAIDGHCKRGREEKGLKGEKKIEHFKNIGRVIKKNWGSPLPLNKYSQEAWGMEQPFIEDKSTDSSEFK